MPTLRKSAYCVSNLACLYHLVGARLHLGQWIHFQWHMRVKSLSGVRLFVSPWTVAYQAPPSMGFSRQEYWSGLPFPSPGNLPDPGIEPRSRLISGRRFNLWATREAIWSKLPFSLSTRCMGSWNKVTSFNSHALSTYHVWSDLWNMLHFIVSDICFSCDPHNNSLGLGMVEVVTSRLGVPHLKDLIPDNLRCSRCNNNRCNNKSAQ